MTISSVGRVGSAVTKMRSRIALREQPTWPSSYVVSMRFQRYSTPTGYHTSVRLDINGLQVFLGFAESAVANFLTTNDFESAAAFLFARWDAFECTYRGVLNSMSTTLEHCLILTLPAICQITIGDLRRHRSTFGHRIIGPRYLIPFPNSERPHE